jgi:hypothetical protein
MSVSLWPGLVYKLGFIYGNNFQKYPEVCSVCLKVGHSQDKCKEQQLTKFVADLPPLDTCYKEVLDGLCAHVHGKK